MSRVEELQRGLRGEDAKKERAQEVQESQSDDRPDRWHDEVTGETQPSGGVAQTDPGHQGSEDEKAHAGEKALPGRGAAEDVGSE